MKNIIISLIFVFSMCLLFAEENKNIVSFSGYLDADMAVDVNNEFKDPVYQANQEIDLTADIAFTDKVSVQLYTTFVTGGVPYGGAPASERWGGLAFDGLTLTWGLSEAKTLYVGDLVYNMGKLNYYGYKRPIRYGSIMPEAYLRGLGADLGDFTFYAGATDLNTMPDSLDHKVDQFGFYGSYGLPLSEKFKLTPKADVRLGGTEIDWHAGVELSLEGDLSLNGAIGAFSTGGMDPNITVLLEPSYSRRKFSIAGTYYQAFGDDNATPASMGEDMFVYVEPGFSFNDIFAVGLPLEYHVFDLNEIWVIPTAYLYPAKDVQVWLWAGSVFPEEGDASFSGGSELIVNF